MKLNQKMLVAAAMILGAMSTLGCNRADNSAPAEATPAVAATVEAPAEAPATSDENATIAAKASVAVKTQPPAPPAPRVENPGRAPSARHQWENGYWRYESPRTQYVWVPGHWEARDGYAPKAPPPPRVEDRGRAPGANFIFIEGHWSWNGRDFDWKVGRWEARRTGHDYVQPRWERVNGRWVKRDGYWRAQPGNGHGNHKQPVVVPHPRPVLPRR